MAEREANRNDGIDVVTIATPPQLHLPVAREFLSRGIHVICEKPFTKDLQEARELQKLARESGRMLCLTHCYTGYRWSTGESFNQRRSYRPCPLDRGGVECWRSGCCSGTEGPQSATLALSQKFDGGRCDSWRGWLASVQYCLLCLWFEGHSTRRPHVHCRDESRNL